MIVRRILAITFLLAALVVAGWVALRPSYTIQNGLYKGQFKMNCMWGIYPPDGNYEVKHGNDGTRRGEETFYKDGKVVTSCHME